MPNKKNLSEETLSPAWRSWWGKFTLSLKSEKRLAANTEASYGLDLLKYLSFLQKKGFTSPEGIGLKEVDGFLSGEMAAGRRAASLARRLSTIRNFHRFLLKEKVKTDGRILDQQSPKIKTFAPTVLTGTEVERIFALPSKTPLGRRDRAFLEFLYSTGCRITEALSLPLAALDLESGLVEIEKGKGGKPRKVFLGRQAIASAGEYLKKGRPVLVKEEKSSRGRLFVNRFGRPLSRMGALKIIRGYVRAAGIRKKVTPHTFRHTKATHFLEDGAPLRFVQEYLGHSDVSTTERYTHLRPKHLKKVFRQYHPRESR
ncbi:MAG: tyrosine-type recombinase/integrase [candidate division Zixibacteria bacterium]|nr:tyrosine-type recombinase/integrase [candidate division Zixibacteria bacterium]